jgi:hypothetical protein
MACEAAGASGVGLGSVVERNKEAMPPGGWWRGVAAACGGEAVRE